MGCIPQLCTDSNKKKKTKKKKRKRCVVKILTFQLLCFSPTLPFHTFFLRFPPQWHLKVACLRVCLCLIVFFCLSGSLFNRSSQAWETAETDAAARPLLIKEGPAVKNLPPAVTPSTCRYLLPVTWLSPPGSSVVCGRSTRPVKRGQSQRWCWSR